VEVRNDIALRNMLKRAIKTKHPKTVAELALLITLLKPSPDVNDDDFVSALNSLVREGEIELREPLYEFGSIIDYLSSITLSGWFWATIALAVVAVLSLLFVPDNFPIYVVRWLLGSVFVLYLPGNTLTHLLFPRRDNLDGLERLLLSVGLSLATVPLVGLILNYLPWGIRFAPITASLTIFVIVFALLAATRQYKTIRGQHDRDA